jgi:hypothetical protein
MPQPAQEQADIYTGKGWLAYLERCRKHDMEAYDALHSAAAEIQASIRRAGGRAWWTMGVDARVLARRMTRPVRHAADLHLESAKSYKTAARIFKESLSPSSAKQAGHKQFDPTK